ncbi:MAG: hypothetical protein Fur0015_01760 [Ignavibacteriales bacterium]
MGLILKKTFYTFAIIFALSTNLTEAKPAYCSDAYLKCLQTCKDISPDEVLFNAGCDLGCYIGYLRCGN